MAFNIDELLTRLKQGAGPSSSIADEDPFNPQQPAIQPVSAMPAPAMPMPQPQASAGPSPQELALRKMIEEKLAANITKRDQDSMGDRIALETEQKRGGLEKLDLSPLFMMAAAAGDKSNAGQMYNAPQDSGKLQSALRDKLSQNQGRVADDELAYLKFKLEGKNGDRMAATQNRFLAAQDNKFYTDFKKDVNKVNDQFVDAHQQIYNVEHGIAPDADGKVSVARVKMALSNFARLMGEKGVLTDQDTGRQLAPTAALKLAQVENWLSTNSSAVKVPAEVVSAMSDALSDAKEAIKTSAKSKIANIHDNYGEVTAPTASMFYNKGGKKVLDKLEGRLLGANSASAGGGSILGQNPADIKAEIERRKKSREPKVSE